MPTAAVHATPQQAGAHPNAAPVRTGPEAFTFRTGSVRDEHLEPLWPHR